MAPRSRTLVSALLGASALVSCVAGHSLTVDVQPSTVMDIASRANQTVVVVIHEPESEAWTLGGLGAAIRDAADSFHPHDRVLFAMADAARYPDLKQKLGVTATPAVIVFPENVPTPLPLHVVVAPGKLAEHYVKDIESILVMCQDRKNDADTLHHELLESIRHVDFLQREARREFEHHMEVYGEAPDHSPPPFHDPDAEANDRVFATGKHVAADRGQEAAVEDEEELHPSEDAESHDESFPPKEVREAAEEVGPAPDTEPPRPPLDPALHPDATQDEIQVEEEELPPEVPEDAGPPEVPDLDGPPVEPPTDPEVAPLEADDPNIDHGIPSDQLIVVGPAAEAPGIDMDELAAHLRDGSVQPHPTMGTLAEQAKKELTAIRARAQALAVELSHRAHRLEIIAELADRLETGGVPYMTKMLEERMRDLLEVGPERSFGADLQRGRLLVEVSTLYELVAHSQMHAHDGETNLPLVGDMPEHLRPIGEPLPEPVHEDTHPEHPSSEDTTAPAVAVPDLGELAARLK